MDDRSTHQDMITALTAVSDRMDAATVDAWDGLTGLQLQLLRVVATDMRVDRQSLAGWVRTSRAALVPSLGGLLQRGILAEEADQDGPYLVVAPAGRQLLRAGLRARTQWMRTAAASARPPVTDAELRGAIEVLRRIADDD
ncbi:MarR family transcriptional regulator [Clavibacter capsici]|uniref:MarR family transcriptional regulator n=1 Tax=Clavibacter capsici TaxID=1874630 RepID=UPI00293E9AED|nr:MarR family transcriptional regulator [Clavibacter capsici]